MSEISPSRLGEENFDSDFERAVANASTAEEIKKLMRERALSTHIVTPDPFDSAILHEVAPGTAPRGYAKTVVINNVKTILQGATEELLLKAENDFYRKTFSPDAEHEKTPRDERGRFVQQREVPDINSQPELDRIQSDLITRALESEGIDPQALRDFSEQRQQQSWESATSEFLSSETWWPGGSANVTQIAAALSELGLESVPSVESLRKAAEYLRDNDRLAENPEMTARDQISEATDFESIRRALGRDHSSLFGSR